MKAHRKLLTLVLTAALVVGGGVMSAAATGSNTISGTVASPGGLVDGAQVSLWNALKTTTVDTATADGNGHYSFTNIPDGDYFLTSFDPLNRYRYNSTYFPVSVGPGSASETVDLTLLAWLTGSSSFSGVVTDAATGAPVTNAHLKWNSDDAGPLGRC